ncbi:phosphatase PAP2 family protein [Sporosarcina sp. GW1-11]|uniref:phosphatase PAP2 family protein n=1 Tax=Sporosarcina sp. GW1-11 TaxID=2899126 RepID=UPI00294BC3A2|nr:phosphatase PAP2 family protein [Sporosarcina sp. GW1-11]MDV6377299.1 phosphatase PAP2 family protein [Sporosarcina sp. GW1-11]
MRELSLRLLFTWLICILLTGFFAFLARTIHLHTITSFDDPIIDFVQGTETPWLTTIMKAFTTIGSTTIVALLTVFTLAFLLWKKNRAQAILLVSVLAGTGILNQVLKFIFKRERPTFHRLIDIGGYSFPSGHTMMAFSLYTILAYIVWRNLRFTWSRVVVVVLAAVMIAMIALSRIYLGVHFPSDIVGGVLASMVWLIASIAMYQRFQRQKEKNSTE